MIKEDFRFIYEDDFDGAGSFAIFIKNSEDIVLGTISGFIYSDCLHIDTLFVNDELQGQGLGKKLLEKAELIGLERGCQIVTVHTMDFEAPLFYQKLGFEIEYIREGSKDGSKLYILQKNL